MSNSATVPITGKQINCDGAGYGMELPSKFKLRKFWCNWIEEKLEKENFDVL